METRGVPLILVTHLPNIRYLTGFTGSAGIVLVGSRTGKSVGGPSLHSPGAGAG